MSHTRLISWELPALLSAGSPSSDPKAKSRRRHHREFLAKAEKKPRVSKPSVEPAPKADRGKAPAGKERA